MIVNKKEAFARTDKFYDIFNGIDAFFRLEEEQNGARKYILQEFIKILSSPDYLLAVSSLLMLTLDDKNGIGKLVDADDVENSKLQVILDALQPILEENPSALSDIHSRISSIEHAKYSFLYRGTSDREEFSQKTIEKVIIKILNIGQFVNISSTLSSTEESDDESRENDSLRRRR